MTQTQLQHAHPARHAGEGPVAGVRRLVVLVVRREAERLQQRPRLRSAEPLRLRPRLGGQQLRPVPSGLHRRRRARPDRLPVRG